MSRCKWGQPSHLAPRAETDARGGRGQCGDLKSKGTEVDI
uniref:Uncharacterized protein n=1 Tax=Arundo donax TaxID=35708 RepID=A0A0A9C4D1_ARUDO